MTIADPNKFLKLVGRPEHQSPPRGGAFCNGLNPTTTLGCGSWGNNSISENFSYFHMMNKTRIATVKPGWTQPSDEEIWG